MARCETACGPGSLSDQGWSPVPQSILFATHLGLVKSDSRLLERRIALLYGSVRAGESEATGVRTVR